MKRTRRRFLSFAALLLLPVILLCGCKKAPEEGAFSGGSIFLDAENSIGLRIVRGDSADDRVILSAMQIRESLRTLCGAEVDLCSDWSRPGDPGHEGPEIHVGITSCKEAKAAQKELANEKEDCYYIRSVGENKILILATGEDLLDEAVERFLADYVISADGGVYIARDISLWVSADGRIDLVRNGVTDGGILLPQDSGASLTEAATRFSEELEALTGVELPVYADNGNSGSAESAKILVNFEKDADPAVAKTDTEGGRVRIRAGSESAAIAALSELLCFVTDSTEVTWNGGLTVYYPVGTTDECTWEHPDIPFLFGAEKTDEQYISGNTRRVVFSSVTSARFAGYRQTLESAGLPLVYSSGKTGSAFTCETSVFHLQVNYDAEAQSATLYITRY